MDQYADGKPDQPGGEGVGWIGVGRVGGRGLLRTVGRTGFGSQAAMGCSHCFGGGSIARISIWLGVPPV